MQIAAGILIGSIAVLGIAALLRIDRAFTQSNATRDIPNSVLSPLLFLLFYIVVSACTLAALLCKG